MAKNKTNNRLESTFLFILMLMILVMSSVSAEGQTIKDARSSDELSLNFFTQQTPSDGIISTKSLRMLQTKSKFYAIRVKDNRSTLLDELLTFNDSTLRPVAHVPSEILIARNEQPLQAPLFQISLRGNN